MQNNLRDTFIQPMIHIKRTEATITTPLDGIPSGTCNTRLYVSRPRSLEAINKIPPETNLLSNLLNELNLSPSKDISVENVARTIKNNPMYTLTRPVFAGKIVNSLTTGNNKNVAITDKQSNDSVISDNDDNVFHSFFGDSGYNNSPHSLTNTNTEVNSDEQSLPYVTANFTSKPSNISNYLSLYNGDDDSNIATYVANNPRTRNIAENSNNNSESNSNSDIESEHDVFSSLENYSIIVPSEPSPMMPNNGIVNDTSPDYVHMSLIPTTAPSSVLNYAHMGVVSMNSYYTPVIKQYHLGAERFNSDPYKPLLAQYPKLAEKFAKIPTYDAEMEKCCEKIIDDVTHINRSKYHMVLRAGEQIAEIREMYENFEEEADVATDFLKLHNRKFSKLLVENIRQLKSYKNEAITLFRDNRYLKKD